jgi:hypothetical protein
VATPIASRRLTATGPQSSASPRPVGDIQRGGLSTESVMGYAILVDRYTWATPTRRSTFTPPANPPLADA